MNKQNPDRGIETHRDLAMGGRLPGMNKQNPDRGIETLLGVIGRLDCLLV